MYSLTYHINVIARGAVGWGYVVFLEPRVEWVRAADVCIRVLEHSSRT